MKSILVAAVFVVLSVTHSGAVTCGVLDKDNCDQTCPSGTRATGCKSCGFLCEECDCQGVAAPSGNSNACLACVTEKNTRDMACPVGGSYTDAARTKCLQDSARKYEECRRANNCR